MRWPWGENSRAEVRYRELMNSLYVNSIKIDTANRNMVQLSEQFDKLMQSHAAIEERLPTKLFAELASVSGALSALDARLKGSTDALSVQLEGNSTAVQNMANALAEAICFIPVGEMKHLKSTTARARRKRKGK